jgi:predicted nucleic acid-binding protein
LPRKLLVDVNVILDVASERAPHHEYSQKVLSLIELKKARGFVSASSFPVLYYLLQRDLGAGDAREYLGILIKLLTVVAVDGTVLEKAMNLPCGDYEDAIQIASAQSCRADFIVTRDARGYKDSPIQAITPAEYLGTFH